MDISHVTDLVQNFKVFSLRLSQTVADQNLTHMLLASFILIKLFSWLQKYFTLLFIVKKGLVIFVSISI